MLPVRCGEAGAIWRGACQGKSTKEPLGGASGVSNMGGGELELAGTSVLLARLKAGKQNGTGLDLHFQRKLLQIPVPPARFLKLVNKSSCIPQVLFKLLLWVFG